MTAAEIDRRLEEAAALVRAAREALAQKRPVALDRLAELVDDACARLARLPRAEAQAFKSRLVALYDDLDSLAKETAREYAHLKGALGDLGVRDRALLAYAKTQRDGG